MLNDSELRRLYGQRIEGARLAAGLNQRELADELTRRGAPTSPQAVSQWENGETSPSLRRRLVLGVVLGVDFLFAIPDDDEVA